MKLISVNNSCLFNNINTLKNSPQRNQYSEFSCNKSSCGSVYEYFNAIKNYNLAFLGKAPSNDENKAIYIIDAYQNYRKFNNAAEAATVLNLNERRIIKCANGDCDNVGGFISAFYDCIEENTRTGQKVDKFMISVAAEALDNDMGDLPNLNHIMPENIPQKKREQIGGISRSIPPEDCSKYKPQHLKNPFYVMNKDGEYAKYYMQAYVADALGVNKDVVWKCINGKQKLVQEYAMAPASEIETKDKNGKTVLKLNKLKERFKEEKYFYAIDENGEYYKFSSMKEAAKTLNISYSGIIESLLGMQKTSFGYMFLRSENLEIKHPDDKISIDIKKIKEIRARLAKKAVYLIDPETMSYKRYDTRNEAAEAIGANTGALSLCVLGHSKTICGKIAVNATDIEKYDKTGKIVIDKKKISDLVKTATTLDKKIDVSKEGFYAIKKDFCKKFYTLSAASRELGVALDSISNCLKGKSHTAGGYVYAFANEIETKDEEGNVTIDKARVDEKEAFFDKDAFYAISNGIFKRFATQKEASEELNLSIKNISSCIQGKNKSAKNIVFVPAEKIETTDKDGKTIINTDAIREVIDDLTKYAIYAVKSDGTYKKYTDRSEAKKECGTNSADISACIAGKRKKCGDYIFINAKDVEIFKPKSEGMSEIDAIIYRDKITSVDENKILEIAKRFSA